MCIAAVYRAPWASRIDTEDLINSLDNLARKMQCIFTGDFNLDLIVWLNPFATPCDLMHDSFQAFVDFNALDQLVEGATRGESLLDLVLVSSILGASSVMNIPPITNSDLKDQLFNIVTPFACSPEQLRATLDYARLDVIRASTML